MALSDELRDFVAVYVNETCPTCNRRRRTLKDVADEMHVTPSSLSRWLMERNEPSAQLLDAAYELSRR